MTKTRWVYACWAWEAWGHPGYYVNLEVFQSWC